MIVFLLALTAWAVSATAVLLAFAWGRRRRDRQAAARARALKARTAPHADPHAAYWGRDNLPAPDGRHTTADGRTRPRHRRNR